MEDLKQPAASGSRTRATAEAKFPSIHKGHGNKGLWTDVLPQTKVAALFLKTDFSQTTLGPIEQWGPSLRCYTTMLFSDSRAVCLYWGPDMIAIYNDGFALSCGSKHPAFMGSPLYRFFPELREMYTPIFQDAIVTGETIVFDEVLLFLERNGYTEETYSCAQHIPVRGESGAIDGFYTNVIEVTTQVLHARRRRALDLIAAIPLMSVDDTLTKTIEALQTIPHDIAAAMIYSLEEVAMDGSTLRLCGSIAIPDNHRIAPVQANLETSQDGLIPLFRQVHRTRKMRVLPVGDFESQASGNIFDGIDWQGYDEPSREIVICPLEIGTTVMGFFFLGLGSRQPYNEATEQSISDLKRQIEARWAASVSKKELDQRHAVLERRASESEQKLRHMAREAPVGMVQVGMDMKIQWANDQFYEITGLDPSKPNMQDFSQEVLLPEDREGHWYRIDTLLEGKPQLEEVRLARKWTPPGQGDEAEETPAWMLARAYPVIEDGKVTLLTAYITDISAQKWAETVQSRNATNATLAKIRQEEFIDITCHEMRNPLSAITQLADGIEASMQLDGGVPTEDAWRSIAQETAIAASTILSCAAHQKRVIDDVLMVSRLDSDLLTITPVVCEANKIVTSVVRMFEGELKTQGTEILASRYDSESTLQADCALLDPSRITQILINLITNAIKFTAPQSVRKISILYAAQRMRPQTLRTDYGDLTWVTPTTSHGRNTTLPEIQDEEERMYMYFMVQDTGLGISPEGMSKLFKRFSQASSRTHISYGGTGLGLYICRQLAEKQGGSVGAIAQRGKGSAFAFYIESRVVVGPETAAGPPPQEAFGSKQAVDPGHEDITLTSAGGESATTRAGSRGRGCHLSFVPSPAPQASPSPAHPLIHVLLVEDNLINQRVLAKQLAKLGCAVTVANHGGEALRILETADCWHRPPSPEFSPAPAPHSRLLIDIVLMDVEMPVMNGLECAKAIRALEHSGQIEKHLPIIAVTANVRLEQKEKALDAGMSSVLSKPFTAREVVGKMREVLAVGR